MPQQRYSDRVKDFPQNGKTYWIRWVDRVSVPPIGRGTTASDPSIDVLLAEIPSHLQEYTETGVGEALAREKSRELTRSVSVGMLPALVPGLVYKNGVAIGHVGLPELTFKTIGIPSVCALHTVWDARNDEAPNWWKSKFPYRTLPVRAYPLMGPFANSCCVELTTEIGILLIPCSEVIRSLYAPTSEMAEALLSGPWTSQQDRIINVAESEGVAADGSVHLQLRAWVEDKYAPYAANLCFDRTGNECAQEVYRTLAAGAGMLHARVPVSKPGFELTGRYVQVQTNPDKYLMLQVTRASWWGADTLVVGRDNDKRSGLTQERVERPSPYSVRKLELADGEGAVSVSSLEDPAAQSQGVVFKPPGIQLVNEPKRIRPSKGKSYVYNRPSQDAETETTYTAAPGRPTHGGSESVKARYATHEEDGMPTRFRAIMRALDEMKSNDEVADWAPVGPEDGGTFRDGLCLWPTPARILKVSRGRTRHVTCRWSRLNIRQDNSPLRGALVCRFVRNGATGYVLEVEHRTTEGGFRYLIFTLGGAPLRDSVRLLLLICAENKGIWPENDELRQRAGLQSVQACRHAYLRSESGNRTLKTKATGKDARRLSLGTLINQIDTVLGRESHHQNAPEGRL